MVPERPPVQIMFGLGMASTQPLLVGARRGGAVLMFAKEIVGSRPPVTTVKTDRFHSKPAELKLSTLERR